MTQIFVLIREEGEYSGREWNIESVCSTLEGALAHACSLAAECYINSEQLWDAFYPPFSIQTHTLDKVCETEWTNVTAEMVRPHHPELEAIIEKRTQAAAAKRTLLHEAQIAAEKLRKRRHLDDQLRNHTLTVQQYFEAVNALT